MIQCNGGEKVIILLGHLLTINCLINLQLPGTIKMVLVIYELLIGSKIVGYLRLRYCGP